MNKIELAYLAGVMDSDGSFSIAIERWRQRNLNIAPAYQEIAALSQIKPDAVHLAKEIFGGSVSMQKPRGIGRYPLYRWQITNAGAAKLASALLPFLRMKRPAAQLLLDLRAIKDRGREANTELTRPRIRTIRAEVAAEMAALAAQIREFNRPTV